jgi:hypothetical protein
MSHIGRSELQVDPGSYVPWGRLTGTALRVSFWNCAPSDLSRSRGLRQPISDTAVL